MCGNIRKKGDIPMKKITSNIACFISGVVIASTVGALAATYTATENTFPIKVNGQDAQMEGYNIDGSTYFKLRDIGDRMGFDVGFEDNTIYVGEIPSVNSQSNETTQLNNTSGGVQYYVEKPWCPDFGAFVGAELLEKNTTDNGTVAYKYGISFDGDLSDYYDLLLDSNLTLNPASIGSFVMFENLDTGHTVVCSLSKTDYTISIIVE